MAFILRLALALSTIGSGIGEASDTSNIVQEDGTLILQEDGVSTLLKE